jgi:hypothetical protein
MLSSGGTACFLFDTKAKKLGIYTLDSRVLRLAAIRLCEYDFGVVQYPRSQIPTVEEMMKKNVTKKPKK